MSGHANPEFITACLNTHNKYRSLHGSPHLTINKQLNAYAQEWAANLASKDLFQHRQPNKYGENLYNGYNSDPKWQLKGDVPVKAWYDEVAMYKFGQPSPSNITKVGHFTQLVWKGTLTLGVGFAESLDGNIYVVCNYDPPGNVLKTFDKNVLPTKQQKQKEKDKATKGVVSKASASSSKSKSEAGTSKKLSCIPGLGICGRPDLPSCPERRRGMLQEADTTRLSSNYAITIMFAAVCLVTSFIAYGIFFKIQ